MAVSKRMKSLFKTSAASCATDNQHIVLTNTTDGRVYAAGTDNLLNGVVGNVELFSKLKECMKDNLTADSVGYANTYQLAYDPLPCSPFSAEWKMLGLGNDVIRDRASMTSAYLRPFLTPPSPPVSECQHLDDPPPIENICS